MESKDYLTTLSRDEMERRRLAAAQELLSGASQSLVARKFGVSRTTASRWYRALSVKGVDSLKKRRAPGRPSRLRPEQLQEIVELFAQGPAAFGFANDRWTTARLAAVIQEKFGVRYDPDHVGRLMHKLGLKQRRVVPASSPFSSPAFAASRYSPNVEVNRPEILPNAT